MTIDTKNRVKLARLLSRVDHLGPTEPFPIVENSVPVGSAFRIGITGPVGAGKSTLINRLIKAYRAKDLTVGVIAVDPSSPFTGGAVLGDRVRMVDLALDQGTFIRSLATRGAFGGLAESAVDAADLLDMFGFDRIIIETVGVGQTEVDIVEACDATVVVLEPSSGDGIQAIKAGLMEIADMFVVNKIDLRGAQRFLADLQSSMTFKHYDTTIKVLPVDSRQGEGIAELCDYLEEYYPLKLGTGELTVRRTEQRKKRVRKIAESIIMKRIWNHISPDDIEEVINSSTPVRQAAHRLVDKLTSMKVL